MQIKATGFLFNNFVLQWGTNFRTGYVTANKTHTFPIAFKTQALPFIQVSYVGNWDTFFGTVKQGSLTLTSFVQGYDIGSYWFAIGY